MADLRQLMEQAQKMQEQMQKAQQELANSTVVGESGAGLVKVTMNGRHEVKSVEMDPSLREEELGFVEDLVAAAFNAAARKVEELNKSSLSSMAGGLNLPEGFKLPF
ncbi:MAG TPA: YbaB/EbfC family nucleoid-associated protein [Pseudomonadaceae bacterium]|nr:YbaB/EbfC family nucleoid-associated protein [Pseudomonadaceae bacterium]